MTIFKLQQFPYVCRLCLQPDPHDKMVPLGNSDEVFEGTIGDFIASFTFVIAESKSHFFPQTVCGECLEMLKFFGKYRSKVMNVHLFMNSLVELKLSNRVPIEDLFMNKQEPLNMLFKDLGLCSKRNPEVVDLINEFDEYKIASIASTTKQVQVQTPVISDVVSIDPNELGSHSPAVFAEECTPDELTELTKQIPKAKRKRTVGTVKKKEFDWDFLKDDNDKEELYLDKSNFENLDSVEAVPRKYGGARSKVPLRCDKCNRYETFVYANFKSHQLTHLRREFRKFHCKETGCSEVFDSAKDLHIHRASNHKKYICETCGYQTANSNYMRNHKLRHTSLLLHVCKYCQKHFKTRFDVQHHIQLIHTVRTTHSCKTCGKEFKRKDILKHHELTHGDEANYHCKQCEKKFKTPSALGKHVNKVHNEPTHVCEHCGAAFHARYQLHDHIESVHEIQIRFVCDICADVAFSRENLAVHRMRHTNPKERECGTCLVVCTSQELFENHMCISFRDDYFCCGRDQRHHSLYNMHMFDKHGIKVNARVRPDPNMLLGKMRAQRKRVESCTKCEEIFPTRTLKKQHMATCLGIAVESIPQ